MAWWMAAIPIGMSLLKAGEDQKRFKEQQKIEAIKEQWSPWTGQHGQNQARPSVVSPVMQGAMSGMAMHQNHEDYLDRKAMRQKYMDSLDAKSSENMSLHDMINPPSASYRDSPGTVSEGPIIDLDAREQGMRYNQQYPAPYQPWQG